MAGPLATGLILAGAGLVSNIASARYQRHLQGSNYQTMVKDMKKAGINPVSGIGATPDGAPQVNFDNPAATALQAKLQIEEQKAGIALVKAQEDKVVAETQDINRAFYEASSGQQFRLETLRDMAKTAGANRQTAEVIADLARDKAMAEIDALQSSAAESKARSLILDYDKVRAMNEADFQSELGKYGPWTRFILETVRGIRR